MKSWAEQWAEQKLREIAITFEVEHITGAQYTRLIRAEQILDAFRQRMRRLYASKTQ